MRVLLVDDQALFLDGLRHLLLAYGLEVAGTAADGLQALAQARALRPDLILMDIEMPRCGGLEATRLIKAEMPEMKIVMLTVSAEDKDLFEALRSGASGYLLKNLDARELLDFLAGLDRGEAALSRGMAARVLKEFARGAQGPTTPGEPAERAAEIRRTEELTPRQEEILSLVAQGITYKEIAVRLYLTEPTIKYHMGQILERLHLRHRTEAIAYAQRKGLTDNKRSPGSG